MTESEQQAELRRQVTEALAELRGAEAQFEQCPSSDNQQVVQYAEWRLNKLLDQLPRGTQLVK